MQGISILALFTFDLDGCVLNLEAIVKHRRHCNPDCLEIGASF